MKANLALGIKNILIKDFKTYEIVKDGDHMRGIGASSIRVPTNTILEFFGQDKVIGCMREMMQKLDLVMFFILPTLSDKDSMRKEMVIYSDAELIDDDISKFHELRDMLKVNKDYMLKNQVDLDTGKEGERLIHWEVGNTKMSRKELEKMLKIFYPFQIYSDFIQDGFSQDTMAWLNEPGSWDVPYGSEPETEGYGGSWTIYDDDQKLDLRPDAKKDLWRKTYYKPMLVKDDAPCYLRTVPANLELTMEVLLSIRPERQFDQGGLVVRIDPEHWLKTGIEVVDGVPRLSCVVTNGFSDWSTQAWVGLSLRIRVTQTGDGSYVVEAQMSDSEEAEASETLF